MSDKKKQFPVPLAIKQEIADSLLLQIPQQGDNDLFDAPQLTPEIFPLFSDLRQASEHSSSESDSDIMGESRSPKCENLTKSNYDSWQLKIETVLATKKCWLKLDGSDSTNADYAETAKRAYYEMTIHCDAKSQPVGEHNSVKVLAAIRERFEGMGFMVTFGLLQKCLTMRQHSGPIINHTDEMRTSFQRLAEKNVKLPEILQVANLNISLPSDLSHAITGIINKDEKDLKFDTEANAILAEQFRKIIADADQQHHVAAPAKTMSRNQRRKLIRCTFCNGDGHIEENCFSKHGRCGQLSSLQTPSTNSTPLKEEEDIATAATSSGICDEEHQLAFRAELWKDDDRAKLVQDESLDDTLEACSTVLVTRTLHRPSPSITSLRHHHNTPTPLTWTLMKWISPNMNR